MEPPRSGRGGRGRAAYPARIAHDHAYEQHIVLWRSLFVAMIRLLNQVQADVKPVLDLTLLDLGVLFSLQGTGAQPMGSLATLFGVDPSVITYRIARLEGMGHVTRGPSPNDGRVINATITRKGRGALARGRTALLHSARDHFFAHVDPADLPTLTRVFEAVLAAEPVAGAEHP